MCIQIQVKIYFSKEKNAGILLVILHLVSIKLQFYLVRNRTYGSIYISNGSISWLWCHIFGADRNSYQTYRSGNTRWYNGWTTEVNEWITSFSWKYLLDSWKMKITFDYSRYFLRISNEDSSSSQGSYHTIWGPSSDFI